MATALRVFSPSGTIVLSAQVVVQAGCGQHSVRHGECQSANPVEGHAPNARTVTLPDIFAIHAPVAYIAELTL